MRLRSRTVYTVILDVAYADSPSSAKRSAVAAAVAGGGGGTVAAASAKMGGGRAVGWEWSHAARR